MPIHDWTRVEAGIFHHFHSYWLGEIGKALNAGLLPPTHYALAEQQAGDIGPDVLTMQLSVPTGSAGSNGAPSPESSTAVLSVAPRTRLSGAIEEKPRTRAQRQPRTIVIRHVSNHRIVALVEVISPGNKSSRNALRAFLRKAVSALRLGIHLLIVDLFPPGRRDPKGIHGALLGEFADSIPLDFPADKPLTLAAYTGGPDKHFYVDFVAVDDELPAMPLFLTPEQHVLVPLESCYRAAWEALPRYWREQLTSGES